MLLLLEGFDGGGLVFLVDASFPAITIDIHQLVNGESVLLIEGYTVQLLDGSDGLFGGLVLNEGETETTC